MTSLTNSTAYPIDTTANTITNSQKDVVVVPTLIGLQKPTRKLVRVFQRRRRLSDFMANIISGFAFN